MFADFLDLADCLDESPPDAWRSRFVDVQPLARLQQMADFYSVAFPHFGMSPQMFVLEIVSSVAALERQARAQDAVGASGTADEARAARRAAEGLRADAQARVDALPEDWPDFVPSFPISVPVGPAPAIGKW